MMTPGRILPITFAGGLLLAVVSCGRSSSLMDSVRSGVVSEETEFYNSQADGAAAASAGASQQSVRGDVQSASPGRPSEAVMTPFPFASVSDAPLFEIFNDSNKYQYPFAEKYGIEPIEDIGMAYFVSKPIVKIANTPAYAVDSLTHSLPYLVPKAATLLEEIGNEFIANLKRRGVEGYRIRVTSLLRTPATVKKLRRVNINATDSSAHKFGTTFDISYLGFNQRSNATPTTDDMLKTALAETMFKMRKAEKCMVKYEVKTHCYHVTVTK